MANTLLQYMRYQSKKIGGPSAAKYLDRKFLVAFIEAQREISRQEKSGGVEMITDADGITTAAYLPIHETKYYKENGGGYCAFLQAWHEYREGCERWSAIANN